MYGTRNDSRLQQRLAVDNVGDAHAGAADFVDEGRADAAPRRADRAFAAQLLVELVDQAVPGHDDVRAVAQKEAAADGDAALFEVLDLAQQLGGVDDDAVADDADLVGVEDAGGDEMELELAELVDDGMAGVVPCGVPGYDLRLFRQEVYDPALALVPPLAAHNHYRRHR